MVSTGQRKLVLSVSIFGLLALVPVLNGGAKLGWLQVYQAYPFVFYAIRGSEWDVYASVASAVILSHLSLSATLTYVLDRVLLSRKNAKS
jgi:hypothetical protein